MDEMSIQMLKGAVKRRVLKVREIARVSRAFAWDEARYLRSSSTLGPYRSRENLAAKITERYHGVEKGLALPAPRPGFGVSVIGPLIRLVRTYLATYGEDDVTAAAVGALREYHAFCATHMPIDQVPFEREISELVATCRANGPGVSGVREMTRSDVEGAVDAVGLHFFTSRHSVRVFAPGPVSDDEIGFAVAAARSAPAVCNRQFGRVRVWQDRETVDELLAVQGGARGFGDQVPAVALITVSLRSYWGSGERHQGWVDGGLFAMNFILGLHAQGLGAVALNWSKGPDRERALRAVLPEVADDEAVIMFVGFGHLPENFRVAASPRM